MAFVTWAGSEPANLYLVPLASHLVLGHPSLVDSLLLAEHDEKPYEYYPTGWNQSDGRSLLGAIRLKGNNWQKDMWECNLFAQSLQVDLFNQLLQAQQTGNSVTLLDYWSDGAAVARQVWLQADRQYLSLVGANSWWRLQFQCWEI